MFRTQAVVTATPALIGQAGQRNLRKVVLYCAANGTAEFKNGATDTGDVLLKIAGLANTTVDIDLDCVGGLAFGTGCWCNVTGTGNILYAWFS
jgi:hypothetical protein